MSGQISFDLPMWLGTIYHSESGATNPWNRVFNLVEVEDEEENRQEAVKVACKLFAADGLDLITIYAIEVAPLKNLPEGGENGS